MKFLFLNSVQKNKLHHPYIRAWSTRYHLTLRKAHTQRDKDPKAFNGASVVS